MFLQSVTNELLHWYGWAPSTARPLLVGATYSIATSVIASIPTSLARSRLISLSLGLVKRRQRKIEGPEASFQEVKAAVKSQIWSMRALSRVASFGEFFGGYSITWTSRRIYWRLDSLLSLGAVILGAGFTVASIPGGLRNPDVAATSQIFSTFPWEQARGYLPLVILAIVVSLLAPRRPVIDRIRARDEAAKDVNKRLAEISGLASEAYYGAAIWSEAIWKERQNWLNSRLQTASAGKYVRYHGGELVQPGPRTRGHRVSKPVATRNLEEDLVRLSDAMTGLRRAGLAIAAARAAEPLTPYLRGAGLQWRFPVASETLLTQYRLEEWIQVALTLRVSDNLFQDLQATREDVDEFDGGDNNEKGTTQSDLDGLREVRLATILETLNNAELSLRTASADVRFQAECLRMVSTQMNRRATGSRALRILSAFGK